MNFKPGDKCLVRKPMPGEYVAKECEWLIGKTVTLIAAVSNVYWLRYRDYWTIEEMHCYVRETILQKLYPGNDPVIDWNEISNPIDEVTPPLIEEMIE
jgi:hypothetical protein